MKHKTDKHSSGDIRHLIISRSFLWIFVKLRGPNNSAAGTLSRVYVHALHSVDTVDLEKIAIDQKNNKELLQSPSHLWTLSITTAF